MSNDFKETLNLPRTEFPMKANLVQKEQEVLDFWAKTGTYQKMQGKETTGAYILHDGPPYANGHIHLGHALNKILKDIIVKYKTMKGFYSPYIPGWDCHGLPIEHEVDKKLGPRKKEISIIEKRTLCKEYALNFLNIQREEFRRLGVFGDWEDPYITMSYVYEASIVREFSRFVESGYAYRSKKPVRWCPSCVTALAEAEVEYSDKESPSVYVKFKVKNPKGRLSPDPVRGTYFVIWTTTPWTLPANMALALHPRFMYRHVITPDGELILAQDLIKDCMKQTGYEEGEYTVTEGARAGEEYEGIVCSHPWIDRDVETILGDHVTLEQGTGIVHTAPGHGEEDYEIGLKYGLDVYAPVNEYGCFTDEVKEFSGQHVYKANSAIIELLRSRSALLGPAGKATHSYPHCWRCKKPVIFRATEQWFISMEHGSLREKALEEIRKVKWIPEWGEDRIYGMVENRPDWCISRQRTWGVPITLFKCKECNEIIRDKDTLDRVVAEVAKSGADVWFIKSENELIPKGHKCNKCGSGEFVKETDILDVWFDSGVSHAAVLELDKRFLSRGPGRSVPLILSEDRTPVLYIEGSDQHRGWFQSSLLTSVGTRGKAPYTSVLTHGFVVDGQGRKMSKSVGNVISPQEITGKYGAEILRLWSASADYREDMRISQEILERLVEAYRKIRNTGRFILGNLYDFDISAFSIEKHMAADIKRAVEIDMFALSLLQGLIQRVEKAYETFQFHEVFHAIYNFCVINMSSFYLDVLKDRLYTLKPDSDERKFSQWVLYNILISLAKLVAPILSFTAEEIWQTLPGKKNESIFLSSFPKVEHRFINKDLENKWNELIKIRDEVNKALEIKRQQKLIGNSLESKVKLYLSENTYKMLQEYQSILPTVFIVSSAEIYGEKLSPEGCYKSQLIQGMAVAIEKADGKKCNRCWNWNVTTGKYDDSPELCERCREVLKG